MLDYDDLSRVLAIAGAEPGAAECHGFLCGQICAGNVLDEDMWKEFMDVQTPDDTLAESCYEQIRVLADDIRTQFNSTDFGFQLMLPGDESPLTTRVAALGAWCQGFLNGVVSGDDVDESAFSEDCREVLKDISLICHVDAEHADPGDDVALEEVVEYVRFGAITLFEDLHPAPETSESEYYH